jgi:hypothetical protein
MILQYGGEPSRAVQRAVGYRLPVTLVQTAEAPHKVPFSACVAQGGMRRLEGCCRVLCNIRLMQGGHGFRVSQHRVACAFPMEKRGFPMPG